MRRFRPTEYTIKAYPVEVYPAQLRQAACIQLMIMNNLDPEVAQSVSDSPLSDCGLQSPVGCCCFGFASGPMVFLLRATYSFWIVDRCHPEASSANVGCRNLWGNLTHVLDSLVHVFLITIPVAKPEIPFLRPGSPRNW